MTLPSSSASPSRAAAPRAFRQQAFRQLGVELLRRSSLRCTMARPRLRRFVRQFLKYERKDHTIIERWIRSGTKAGALCGLLLGLLPDAHAAVPVFTQVGGACDAFTGIDVGSASVPRFADLDGDGDLDVFIGALDGTIRYYTNTGTNINPTLVVQVGAANPLNGVDIGSYATPTFVDIDGDGDLDMFTGANGAGGVRFFRNGGDAISPSFAEVTGAANPFNGVAVVFGAPTFVDIDNDGDRDAFLGQQDGTVRFFRNTGTAAAPVMTEQVGAANPFNGVNLGSYSAPAFVDMDGDGDIDAFLGSQAGTMRYFENTGTVSAPVFTEVVGAGNPLNGFDVGNASTPVFADLDGDSDQDAFVGVFTGTVTVFRSGSGAPILTSAGLVAGTYTEGGAGVAPAGTPGLTEIEIADCDSANLSGASIAVTNRQPGDVLSFTNQNGITGSFTAATGVLTLSGSASIANYQTAMRSVTFTSTSDDPAVGGTANMRAISVSVTDDTALTSNARTHGVAIAGVNDAPSITASPTIAVMANVASVLTGITFADIDAGAGSVTATLSVPSGTLSGTSGAGVTVGGSGTATLTLAGSLADLNAFIAAGGAKFTTALNATTDVTLTLGINDGGNSGGGGALTGSGSTTLVVASTIAGTKTVSGTFAAGGVVTYTVVLSNSGGAQGDNPGNEFTDVLPAGLSIVSSSATSGTTIASIATNTVTWNGSLAAGGSVTITIAATIGAGATGTISNQGSFAYDADGNGTNETSGITDDPGVAGAGNPTSFTVSDTTPPSAPSAPDLAAASDSGSLSTDNITNDTTPTFTGTAEAGSTVRLFAGVTEVGSATATGGNWSITASALVAGTYTFSATATDASGNVSPASAGLSVVIDTTPPAIAISAPSVSSTSAGPVSYTVSYTDTNLSALTLAGFSIAGASAANYALLPPTLQASIQPGWSSLSFVAIDTVTVGVPVTLRVVASRNVAVSFSVVSGPATLNGDQLTVTAASTVTVRATQPGDSNYLPASAELTIPAASINRVAQTLAFAPATGLRVGEPFTLSATASSGLPVAFTLVSGNATLVGATLTPADANPIVVRATQPGNEVYAAAAPVEQTIVEIAKRAQTIMFAAPADRRSDAPAFSLAASASSGLPVSFVLVSGPATLNGGTLTPAGSAGTIVVRASQPGDAAYAAAPDVERAFNITALIVGRFVMIVGFVVNGDTPARILVRAIGPGLAPFGLSPILADPRVQLFRGSELVASNDDATTAAHEAGAGVGAFGLAAGSRDAAFVVTVEPGAYTVVLSGADATAGIALLEVYELP